MPRSASRAEEREPIRLALPGRTPPGRVGASFPEPARSAPDLQSGRGGVQGLVAGAQVAGGLHGGGQGAGVDPAQALAEEAVPGEELQDIRVARGLALGQGFEGAWISARFLSSTQAGSPTASGCLRTEPSASQAPSSGAPLRR